jgi:hypothetical protein
MNGPASIDTLPTLLDFAPNAVHQNVVRDLANLHLGCLASFLTPKPHYPGQYHSLGTGFYVVWPENPDIVRLVTAVHVLEGFDFKHGRITIGGRCIALGDVGHRNLDINRDVVVWSIPSRHFIHYGITIVAGFPLWLPDAAQATYIPTQSFVIMGYPASKNKALDFRDGKEPDRQITAMAIHASPRLSNEGILHLAYSGKGITESWVGMTTTSPHLKGMSGSPFLRIVFERDTDRLGMVLAGVFTERDKLKQQLSAGWFGDPWLVPSR